MESKALRHFVQVVEQGSVTQAAKVLHIAQPALSISIQKLEKSLGVNLFRRHDKTLSLTQEGQVLLPHAKRVCQQLQDAKWAIDEMKGLKKGEVRLGAPSMMGSYFLPPLIMAFKQRYPDLKISLLDAGTQSIRQMLLDGELDLGVIIDEEVSDKLVTDRLFSSPMVAVTSSNHPLAKQKSVSFDDFFSYPHVMFKPGYFHRDYLDRIAKRYQYHAHLEFETNLLAVILTLVKAEQAITALLKLVTDNEPDLAAIPFEHAVPVDLALAWRTDGYLSLADRAFIDFVKEWVDKYQ
ncbi:MULTISPECIES: LysR family transcriptional regulator [unclassified Vibrio]|uniref:LysR family transcriptional regulator n=1 Tax=Vibrio sp. HB236076 TaxID=3232307 RepID=A0AB39HD23_9VIBR|nr:LysR family transcriptional regulator [Vibrio sp. HB161653]MDP5253466.1 LysR family transcriptional regulator [Vibrio sp. HB161653]